MSLYIASGWHHVVRLQRVRNIGNRRVPVLWLSEGMDARPFGALIEYYMSRPNRSLQWQRKAARAVGLFYDFSKQFTHDPDKSIRKPQTAMLTAFIAALRYGTIENDCTDKTGLYWTPLSANVVNDLVRHLDYFVAYLAVSVPELPKSHPLNDLNRIFISSPRDSATLTRFLITARRLSKFSMMEHIKNPTRIANNLARRHRNHLGVEAVATGDEMAKPMSQELIADILTIGCIKNENATALHERIDITAKLIFLLLAGGGLRKSEPLHMWYSDVKSMLVDGTPRLVPMLQHPSQSLTYIEGVPGSRRQYLAERGMVPRNESTENSFYSGWKNLPVDRNTKGVEVFFYHPKFEEQFRYYFPYYLDYRRHLIAERKANGGKDHPFLFVSKGKDGSTMTTFSGAPYSKSALDNAFSRALRRIERSKGIRIERGKNTGNTLHGMRHAYAMALFHSGANTKVIQRTLHHRSPLSQSVYTNPDFHAVNAYLTSAQRLLETKLPIK